jgi:Ca2+-binding RTX toxin-like protein
VRLALSLTFGHGRIQRPLQSCRGTRTVECELGPLAPRGSTHLDLSVTTGKAGVIRARASVAESETDFNPASNIALSDIDVLDCDVVGTPGADKLAGTPGRDSICGLPGADHIRAGAGNDTIEGGSGSDTINAGPGRDVVKGSEGNDRIDTRDGERDVIDCGPQRDTVHADRLDKVLHCERVVRARV